MTEKRQVYLHQFCCLDAGVTVWLWW